jgi:hypothetical protein
MEIKEPITVGTLEQKDNFKLSINAKGNFQWEIKVYGTDIEEIKSKVEALNDWAQQTYGSSV